LELIVGKTVQVDEKNRYFFAGKIENETIKGWGYTRYYVSKLGPMAGTLMAGDPNVPKVSKFITLAGEPYIIRYNSRVPIVVYVPEGVEVRYRIWTTDVGLKEMQKGYAASKEEYQNVFVEHLEMGPATYLNLNVHGATAADIDNKLTELYHGNGLQPFWIRDGMPDKRAADILAVLEDAESHGLHPDSYFIDMIHNHWDRKDTVGLVRLDMLLTLGMMRYVADQAEGRIEPHEVDPKLFATARDVEVDWEDDVLYFYEDIYGRDQLLAKALFGSGQ